MRTPAFILAAVLTAIGSLAAAEPPVDVRTSVSRTALWVGDHVVYTVELRCDRDVDVLLDDLLKERLRVEGGDIISAESERDEINGRTTHRVRYTLVTYRIDVPAITVRPIPVRYYARARGQRPGDAAPAGEVTIPQRVVSVRSTIPEVDQAIGLQPPGDARTSPRFVALAWPVGMTLILIAVVPAALVSLNVARRVRDARTRYQARRRTSIRRRSFDEIQALNPASEVDRRAAFGQLDAYIRDHLSMIGVAAVHSLTPSALARSVQSWTPPGPSQTVESVLATCERARYSAEPSSREEWDAAVRGAREIIGHTRKK